MLIRLCLNDQYESCYLRAPSLAARAHTGGRMHSPVISSNRPHQGEHPSTPSNCGNVDNVDERPRVGPISSRKRTDLEPEADRSRRGEGRQDSSAGGVVFLRVAVFWAVLVDVFRAVVVFLAAFLVVVFFAAVLRVVRFLAGPLARFSASSS